MNISFILFALLILVPAGSLAQIDTLVAPQDSTVLLSDSMVVTTDSLHLSTTKSSPIDEVIQYPAADSTVYDIKNQVVKMYNKAKVTYGDITLESDFIAFDFQKNEVLAFGKTDSLGQMIGKPVFSEGSQSFDCDTIRYNFDSKQGLISSVKTSDNESYVHAEKSKRHSNEQIHNIWGKYTTCSLDNPHYYFRFKKMIVIPDEKIVTGPIYMKVRKIPTPLALPFGFFPNSDKQKSGLIMPSYGESGSLGFYLIGGGYYQPLGEKYDTQLTADLYSRGSWGLKNYTRYVKKYKYSGGVTLTYNSTRVGDTELGTDARTNTMKLSWNHRQSSKASINRKFSANVNLGSIKKDRNNFASSSQNYIKNNSNSTISYSRSWRKAQISSTIKHNQNSQTGFYNFTLPSLSFSLNRFYLPTGFLHKTTLNNHWYDKIAINYSSNLDNKLNNLTESDLRLNRLGLLKDNFTNGLSHRISTSTSIKLGPFSINPNINYNQRWHFKRNERVFNPDSLTFDDHAVNGFWVTDDISFGASMTSKIYGKFQFKSERLKAIRHVMTPSIGFSYRPERDYDLDGYEQDGLFFDPYNPYTISAYQQSNNIENGSITYSMINNLEMKIRDRKDTTGTGTKKVSLLDYVSLASSYNLLADSLQMADISLNARTRLSKHIDITYNSSYNPYEMLGETTRRNVYRWQNGNLPTLNSNTLSINFRFNGGNGKKKNTPTPIPNNVSPEELAEIDRNRSFFVDFNVPWSFTASYTYSSTNKYTIADGYNIETTGHNVVSSGDVRLFEKWKLAYSGAYNIEDKKVTSLSLNLHWDLHCWELVTSFVPIGTRRNYNIRLNVKASILQDLKLQKRGDIDGNGFIF